MENNEILNVGIGNIEKESNQLKPSKVAIVKVNVKDTTKEGKKMETPLIIFEVKHPDSQNHISISKIKQLVGEKVYTSSTWFTTDDEDKIQKDMPLSRLMKFVDAKSLTEMIGKEIDTVEESDTVHYLVFKAY